MARRGDGIYLRGRTWRLDFRHDGRRYIVRLGRNISRTAAGEVHLGHDPEQFCGGVFGSGELREGGVRDG
jgi:hypothetical protein